MADIVINSNYKKKNQQQQPIDPTDRCSYALQLIEEIEHSSRKEDEEFKSTNKLRLGAVKARDSSEDSNDSLIQTQRKMKHEYEEYRKSQEGIDFIKSNKNKPRKDTDDSPVSRS